MEVEAEKTGEDLEEMEVEEEAESESSKDSVLRMMSVTPNHLYGSETDVGGDLTLQAILDRHTQSEQSAAHLRWVLGDISVVVLRTMPHLFQAIADAGLTEPGHVVQLPRFFFHFPLMAYLYQRMASLGIWDPLARELGKDPNSTFIIAAIAATLLAAI